MALLSISSEPESSVLHLEGERVKLWPYMAGVYSRDLLGRLWRVIETHGDGARLFWGNANPPDIRMDLPAFCAFFSSDSRALLLITNPDGSEIIGCTWWDDIVPGHHAFGSLYMVPAYRGRPSLEATRLSAQWAFSHYACRQLWALTPWPEVASMITHAGFSRVATLPAFALWQGQTHDVGVFRKVRD